MGKKIEISSVKKTLGRPKDELVSEGHYYHRNYGPLPNDFKFLEYRQEEVPGYTNEKDWQPSKKTRAVLISMSNVYNLGVRWIQATAMNAGFDCHTIFFGQLRANDWRPPTEKDWNNLRVALKEIDPKVIGLSVACTSYYKQAIQIDKFVREVCPEAVIIWGSIHVYVAPEQCFEHCDVICMGEGEMPFLELLERIEAGEPFHDVPNLWVRDRATGKEYRNYMRPVIRDLDSIPAPIWDNRNKWYIRQEQIEKNQDPAFKEFYIFVMTNRGCPYHCNYCVNSILNQGDYRSSGHNRLRQRSVGHVLAELESMRDKYWNFDNLQISFFDDIFTLNPKWVVEFSQEYKKRFNNSFWCYFHPRNITEEMMDALKDIGLNHVDMGVQTGCERVRLNLMKRPESNESIIKSVKVMKDRNIGIVIDVITDNPFETEEDMRESLDFFFDIPGPYMFNFYSLIYFPGVQLTQLALDGGYITRDQVEDEAAKTLDQFVATFKYTDRRPLDAFFIPLYYMASRRVYSRKFVTGLSRNEWVRKNPWVLHKLVNLQNLVDMFHRITKIPRKIREGWTWRTFYARLQLYLGWEKPYNK
ncbi:MAG: radical SAM protein [bacterium]|nr:radical SAM protein [bacterium]